MTSRSELVLLHETRRKRVWLVPRFYKLEQLRPKAEIQAKQL
jgi:hypothetical protein